MKTNFISLFIQYHKFPSFVFLPSLLLFVKDQYSFTPIQIQSNPKLAFCSPTFPWQLGWSFIGQTTPGPGYSTVTPMSTFQMQTFALDARLLITWLFCWLLTCLAWSHFQPVHLAVSTLDMGSSTSVRVTYCVTLSLPEPLLFSSAKWED